MTLIAKVRPAVPPVIEVLFSLNSGVFATPAEGLEQKVLRIGRGEFSTEDSEGSEEEQILLQKVTKGTKVFALPVLGRSEIIGRAPTLGES